MILYRTQDGGMGSLYYIYCTSYSWAAGAMGFFAFSREADIYLRLVNMTVPYLAISKESENKDSLLPRIFPNEGVTRKFELQKFGFCWPMTSKSDSQSAPWNKSIVFRSKSVVNADPPGHWPSSSPLRFNDDWPFIIVPFSKGNVRHGWERGARSWNGVFCGLFLLPAPWSGRREVLWTPFISVRKFPDVSWVDEVVSFNIYELFLELSDGRELLVLWSLGSLIWFSASWETSSLRLFWLPKSEHASELVRGLVCFAALMEECPELRLSKVRQLLCPLLCCWMFDNSTESAVWQCFAVSHCPDMIRRISRHSLISLTSS